MNPFYTRKTRKERQESLVILNHNVCSARFILLVQLAACSGKKRAETYDKTFFSLFDVPFPFIASTPPSGVTNADETSALKTLHWLLKSNNNSEDFKTKDIREAMI